MKILGIPSRRASSVDLVDAKSRVRQLWSLCQYDPVSFVRDPLIKTLENAMSTYPDATVYASRACRPAAVQEIKDIGVPFRQYETNFLGHTAPSSIVQTLNTDTPAIVIASASTKTGSSDIVSDIRDAISACGIQHSMVHMVADEVAGILPYTASKRFLINIDQVDSFSCDSLSFGISQSVGILAGVDTVPDDDAVPLEMTEAIRHCDLETLSRVTMDMTVAIFEIFFSHRIPSYILHESNVILVKVPEHIRQAYALEVYDGWTCLRILPNTEAGALTNIINDIVYHYEMSR